MAKLLRKTLCIITILLMLLSLLRSQQASGLNVEVDHDHQEKFRWNRPDAAYNVSADVYGYYKSGQRYNHTLHSIEFDQIAPDADFLFQLLNATYYGLDLQGQIVYKTTFRFNETEWYPYYSHNSSFDSAVYFAYTYIKVKVWDLIDGEKSATVTLTAWVSRRNDVAVSNVTVSPSEVYSGENVSIMVVVENEGAVSESFNVTVYRNDTAIGTQTVSDLTPGNETTLTFNWNTTGVTPGNYEIKAEASEVPGERDTMDNTYINGAVKVLNNPPYTPSKPSGPATGNVYTTIEYSASTTDPEGHDVLYEFSWGDDTPNTIVGPYPSEENASASHQWKRPLTYEVKVQAKDIYGAESGWSNVTSITLSQNDAGEGVDAGNNFEAALSIIAGSYYGTLYEFNPDDIDDYYQFYVQTDQSIYVSMTPPSGVNFDLELYSPDDPNSPKDESHNGDGYTDSVSYIADSSGYWRVRIYIVSGEGQYSFYLSVTWPGGCPYVSTWDGAEYLLDNNLLVAFGISNGTDVTDYYLLQQTLAQGEDGLYPLLISEFQNEHDFFDWVQLVVVDHSSNVNVAVSPYGEILTYTEPSPPVSAIDGNNQNVKHLISSVDGEYYEGYNGSYITLNFGEDLDVSQGAKLVMRADLWYKRSIYIQIQDADGGWNTVASVIPRVFWATEIIDLSEHLPDAKGNLKVRLYFTANHKIDFVGLDTSPHASISIYDGQLESAVHSVDGDVLNKLLYKDQAYAELVPGQQIELLFTLPNQTMEARSYIIITIGHYFTIET